MLLEESLWIQDVLKNFFTDANYPILNIGSSTRHFRENVQPHIHENVFAPLEKEGKKVVHLDMKTGSGVDLVGDLNNKTFREQLANYGFKSVICSNLLEHLSDPQTICNSILELLQPGGLILVTVPLNFPYHKDPIDTLLRPSDKQVHEFFPGTKLITSSVTISDRSYAMDLLANKKYLLIMIARLCMPFFRFSEWPKIFRDFRNCRRKYSATCVLLEK